MDNPFLYVKWEEGEARSTCSGVEEERYFSQSAESKGCNFSTSTGVLRISKGDGGELQGMKVGQLYRLEGSVWTAEANARHRSSSTGKKQGKQGVRSRNDTNKIGAGEITGPKAQRRTNQSITISKARIFRLSGWGCDRPTAKGIGCQGHFR